MALYCVHFSVRDRGPGQVRGLHGRVGAATVVLGRKERGLAADPVRVTRLQNASVGERY